MMKFAFERSFCFCLMSLVVLLGSTGAFAFVHRMTYPTTRAVDVRYTRPLSILSLDARKLAKRQLLPVWCPRQMHSSSALYSSESSSTSDDDTSTPEEDEEKASSTKLTFGERWAKAFPKKKGDELPLKQRLAKMGLACVLSYGFVSNMNAGITTGLSWFVFAKKTGLSPLAPGQWKPFLAVYAGFWVVNNFIRPLRVGIAVAISPYFDRAVLAFQNRMKVNKAVAIGITVFLANVVITTLVTGLGIVGAATFSGTPIFPPKA